MTDFPTRRQVLVLAGGTAVALSALPAPALAAPVLEDVILGDPEAPVTVIEYASFTCPHCQAFHQRTFPEIKRRYVDTGKARFILREVYFDGPGLWASMLARCGGEKGFYPLSDQLLKQRDVWAGTSNRDQVSENLYKIGRLNGLSTEQLNACFGDQDYARTLVERFQQFAADDDVNSTPTFIINGEKTTGNMPVEDFAALIEKHL